MDKSTKDKEVIKAHIEERSKNRSWWDKLITILKSWQYRLEDWRHQKSKK